MRAVLFLLKTLLVFGTVHPALSQKLLITYLKETALTHRVYNEYNTGRYNRFVKALNLADCQSNRESFIELTFLHDLLTGKDSRNFVKGGILETPYFWHWVKPNPRHDIIWKKTGVVLNKVTPPEGFEKYKSRADIDRTPFIYLSELFSESPMYYHKKCGDFYSFGWCSEREMAFNALAQLMGYSVKIKQEGIHTFSEVWVRLVSEGGKTIMTVFRVDNTFDEFEYYTVGKGITITEWLKDLGRGSTIVYYNKKSRSDDELGKVSHIKIGELAVKRVEFLLTAWLTDKKKPFWIY